MPGSRRWTGALAGLLAAILVLSAVRISPTLFGLENLFYDAATRLVSRTRRPDPRIVIVAISETTTHALEQQYGRWPYSRAVMALVVEELQASGARVIVFDQLFAERNFADEGDAHFAAELAAVIGHEIAHATEKHILKEIKRANVLAAGVDLAQSEVGRGGLSDNLARKIADLANDKLFKTGIGRREELDSDRVGVQLAAAAGYRANAYLHFLESLSALAKSRNSAFAQLGATHPRPDDRIRAIRPLAGKEDKGQLLAERWATWSGQ